MRAEDLLAVAGVAPGGPPGGRPLPALAEATPRLKPFGLGGDEMMAAGFEAVAHSSEIAVVGITEALRILPRAWRIFRQLLAEVDRRGARTAVLIDSPDFNLRLAKELHRRGVGVVYYISPQVWAWRRRRVKLIARTVGRMLVVFPFELDFYRRHGVKAVYVGHPLIDEVPRLDHVWDHAGRPERFVVSLLPGSRKSEVKVILPIMLASVRRIAERLPIEVRLIMAPTMDETFLDQFIITGPAVERVTTGRFEAIAGSHLALCASGTATVEVSLLGTPMVVTHRINPVSYFLASRLVDLDYVCMVNLVLERSAVPELLQHDSKPELIADAAVELLESPEKIETMRAALAELRPRLGASGASRRAAAEVAAYVAENANGAGR